MNTEDKKPAVILLSGGLDSATCAAMAVRDGFELYAMTIRYGQRHSTEIEASRRVRADPTETAAAPVNKARPITMRQSP